MAYLQYGLLLHNSICQDEAWLNEIVSSGLARKTSVKDGKGETIALECELIVQEYLKRKSKKVEKALIEHYGQDIATLAERAVAFAIVKSTDQKAHYGRKQ